MIRYEPAAAVLPEYSDELLQDRDRWGGKMAGLLLQVPAEYRQAVVAEAVSRAGRDPGLSVDFVADVVAEVLDQLGAGASR